MRLDNTSFVVTTWLVNSTYKNRTQSSLSAQTSGHETGSSLPWDRQYYTVCQNYRKPMLIQKNQANEGTVGRRLSMVVFVCMG